ncbi:MAG TPA: flagellar export protein FliJ [Solirubrobacteraceae bacterium]|nr:flagellar export protein FliJ [Solirubrobacteraceae bacterium]
MSTARFRFGLERVREIRAHDEDRAKEAFAASLAQRMRGAALLAAAAQQLDDAQAARRGGAPSASGQDLVSMQAYLDRVEQSRRDAERELEQSESALLARRQALTEASRRRQALERLKERRAAEHAAEAARREGAFLDEVALSAHVRKGAA